MSSAEQTVREHNADEATARDKEKGCQCSVCKAWRNPQPPAQEEPPQE